MSTSISGTTANPNIGSATTAATTTGTDSLATRDTFLKLLIAQIRNQNPLSPTDGTQFVSQLAQFSSLEQNVEIRDTLTAIQKTLNDRLPDASTTPTKGSA
jgi:flagellar basal-body rod modification protein FlgD